MDRTELIRRIIAEAEKLVPEYLENEEDRIRSRGGAAICIIDAEGNVYGKMFGTEPIQMRETYRIAWVKASQVHITGYATGEYERLVFNKEIDDTIYKIRMPDLIGWQGGQPITAKDGTKLSAAFSGFRGIMDLEIVTRALAAVEG
jgi:glc operon protein GlcG